MLSYRALARRPLQRVFAGRASTSIATDSEAKLRSNIKTLGAMLGSVIKEDDSSAFDAVEKLRALGKKWRAEGKQPATFDEMVGLVKSYDASKLLTIARAFTHFLTISNSAENHHRIRRLREGLLLANTDLALPSKEDSCGGSIKRLLQQGVSQKEVLETFANQSVEIVLTAHPTEVNRRTMIQKHRKIRDLLEASDRDDLTLYERQEIDKGLKTEITCIWESDELKRSKPSPIDEAKGGFAVIESVLWEAVPSYMRKLNDVFVKEVGSALPLTATPIKLSSWMGGDRDGNPNVTPAITLEVTMLSRWMGASLFKEDLASLRTLLSLKSGSPELENYTKGAYEPYRVVLKGLEARLQATMEWTMVQLKRGVMHSDAAPLLHNADLLEPLMMMHRSLVQTHKADVANGALTDVIRKLHIFGLQLLSMDIRQESTRHTEALDCITTYLGMGSYKRWDEQTRRIWLEEQLISRRPLLNRGKTLESYGFPPSVLDTLGIFELIAKSEPGSLGAYVISQCQHASDVMAVALLQQDAGVAEPLRVVPLFETLDDLTRAPPTCEALFSSPVYKALIKGRHEIMVGYSDSAKDAGRLASNWALYRAQTAVVEVAKRHDVEVTFFHGKGGTVGRGGNPAVFKAILAHPPHTVNGRFRVTEQGEMITQNLGTSAIAERTIDLFTAGVLSEKFEHRPEPKKEWMAMMDQLASMSCDAYRAVVVKESRFVPYFRTATPEQELAGLNVGSRPAKRNPSGGVESLRAIPWIFSWTQTRLNLPAWLGVGDALSAKLKTDAPLLKEMYAKWPWFQTVVDLIEMILVKSEKEIAANYDNVLVHDAESKALGAELREKLTVTMNAVLAVSGHKELQENNTVLLRSLQVRNPYVDPLNIIQAELLLRLRASSGVSDANKEILRDALLITINGIANGMRNSG